MKDKFEMLLIAQYNSIKASSFIHRKIILVWLGYERENMRASNLFTRASPVDASKTHRYCKDTEW